MLYANAQKNFDNLQCVQKVSALDLEDISLRRLVERALHQKRAIQLSPVMTGIPEMLYFFPLVTKLTSMADVVSLFIHKHNFQF